MTNDELFALLRAEIDYPIDYVDHARNDLVAARTSGDIYEMSKRLNDAYDMLVLAMGQISARIRDAKNLRRGSIQ